MIDVIADEDEIVEVNGVRYIPFYVSEVDGLSPRQIEDLIYAKLQAEKLWHPTKQTYNMVELTLDNEGVVINERLWSSEQT